MGSRGWTATGVDTPRTSSLVTLPEGSAYLIPKAPSVKCSSHPVSRYGITHPYFRHPCDRLSTEFLTKTLKTFLFQSCYLLSPSSPCFQSMNHKVLGYGISSNRTSPAASVVLRKTQVRFQTRRLIHPDILLTVFLSPFRQILEYSKSRCCG